MSPLFALFGLVDNSGELLPRRQPLDTSVCAVFTVGSVWRGRQVVSHVVRVDFGDGQSVEWDHPVNLP